MTNDRISIAIDFGTSNTVVAIAHPDGAVDSVKFRRDDSAVGVYMSVLCFWEERRNAVPMLRAEGGPWAVDQFLSGIGPHRFIQSFKTYAASRAFQETWIFRRKHRFEDLLAAFLRSLMAHAETELNFADVPIIVGRPVCFAGVNADERLAISRYTASFEKVGAKQLHYVYEPTGAAFSFARRLDRDATVLIADFGGGTSDFSIMRFSRRGNGLRAQPLGAAGIGIAGDAFDYRIIDHVVSPKLGKGGRYRSFDKLLTIPDGHYSNFARWSQLAMMKSSGELKELVQLLRVAVDPEPLATFIKVIENDLGFELYRAVSATKVGLSSKEQERFTFRSEGIDIDETVRREDFERWIAPDVKRIAATVDKALVEAEIGAGEIDRVFLTGGSSFIPAIRRIFSERFGDERLETGDQFESIACGLALIGQSQDIAQWSAPIAAT